MKSPLRCDTSHLRSVRSAGTSREEHLFSWPAGDSRGNSGHIDLLQLSNYCLLTVFMLV